MYILGGGVLLYWLEVLCSSSRKYLSNFRIVESVEDYVDRLRTYRPHVWWSIQCYHYREDVRTEVWYENGTRRERVIRTRVRVNTHSASGCYEFDAWRDVSKPLAGIDEHELTKITYTKHLRFADAYTHANYDHAFRHFVSHNDRDQYKDVKSGMKIRDFTTKMLSTVHGGTAVPPCLSLGWYLLVSMCCLATTCYRCWFGAVSGRTKFAFLKEVKKNPHSC